MDLNDYWQENKRFLVSVGIGLLVFLIGNIVVDAAFGSGLREATGTQSSLRRRLREARFGQAQRAQAKDENQRLHEALTILSDAVAFEPRPEFQLHEGMGSPSNQFFSAVERVRDELTLLASQNRMTLWPDDEGIEVVKTTSDEIIVRHFEALDVIDRVVHLAAAAGVKNIAKLKVDLDPAFESRAGLGAVERTRVEFHMISDSEALTHALTDTQSERYGKALPIERFEFRSSRSKPDEVRVEVTFLVVRLRDDLAGDEEEL